LRNPSPWRRIDDEGEAVAGKDVAAIVGHLAIVVTRWVSLRSTHPTGYGLVAILPTMTAALTTSAGRFCL
jgi:hypothetical protein